MTILGNSTVIEDEVNWWQKGMKVVSLFKWVQSPAIESEWFIERKNLYTHTYTYIQNTHNVHTYSSMYMCVINVHNVHNIWRICNRYNLHIKIFKMGSFEKISLEEGQWGISTCFWTPSHLKSGISRHFSSLPSQSAHICLPITSWICYLSK